MQTDIRRDDTQRARVKAICQKVKDSDAIWGYNLWNERLDWCGDFEKLDAEDKTRFAFLLGDFIANTATAYQEVEFGIMTEAEFAEGRDEIRLFLTTPGGRAFWERFGTRYSEAFREYVARDILRHNS